ncbi:unnamed protein product [Oppiella nova]|uniref:Sphingomyelin phosphodiesterase n=1 Tax=Oppiella nova TaxID=334625 RepID=A0A7R9LM63_9ACAR|nr:unnamed protein product [Oppiella nova]CAG2164373.1 unnamed protein product [Oppiella nova]
MAHQMKIRAFPVSNKLDTSMDDKYVQSLLAVVMAAIESTMIKQFTGSCEEVYRSAYSLVLHNRGELLYNELRDALTRHVVNRVSRKVATVSDNDLVATVTQLWADYDISVLMVRDMLMYMERVYITQNNVPGVRTLGANLFRDHVIPNDTIARRLTESLLEMVGRERAGEPIDRSVVRASCHMLTQLGVDSRAVYEELFERPFLRRSAEYYRLESRSLLAQNDASVYVKRVEEVYDNIRDGVKNRFTCYSCEMVIGLTKLSVYSVTELNYLMAGICESFRIEDRRVCGGLSDLFSNEIYYIIRHTNLSRSEVCATLIGAQCLSDPCAKRLEWEVNLTDSNHTSINTESTEYSYNTYDNNISKSVGNAKVLHLSDLHIDPYYTTGADSDCGEPLCCRPTSAKGKGRAGFWGDYNACDSPKYTIEKLMAYINTTIADDYEYIIWTGDITAHDVWNTTRETIVNGSRSLTSLITKYISNGKLVFPVVGNHEGLPVNQFPPPEIQGPLSNAWLYRELLAQWSQWIPNGYHQTFLRYGYYANNVSKLLKVVVLNTNACARINFWLMLNPNDPGGQLQWLVRELLESQRSGQSVHIIGHIPPDNTQCISQWVHNYLQIVDKYSQTIKGQFFGHTHFDEFRVLYSPSNQSVPISVAYLAPSVTPYESVNPAFRLYSIDSAGTILDHQNYYLNLTDANLHPDNLTPQYIIGYTAKQAYNMSSLAPADWHQLYDSMKSDDQLFESYYNHYHRYSDAFPKECTADLKTQILNAIPIYNPIVCKKPNDSMFTYF